MPRLLGIDTGGTYTDAVLFSRAGGVLAKAKALTTKHDLSLCVGEAMDAVLDVGKDDEPVELVSLSTTLATNAVVEGQGSPVCLILIGYDRKALERSGLGSALGKDPVVFIEGGHHAGGDEAAPLDLAAAREAVARHASRVSAFAVAGHFAVRNPAHEIAVCELVRELSGRPVTAAHQLSSGLDAPRRALTAVLNARLISQLQDLILAVRGLLAARGIAAPLMIVKGDGSLVSAGYALERPIETVLSGPAASAVGAVYLATDLDAKADGASNDGPISDMLVSDIGGTTSDVAVLRDGRPLLSADGAVIGGWKTMVRAVAVRTFGLGGDSEVTLEACGELRLGPRRNLPLALLARDRAEVLETLEAQLATARLPAQAGRFAVRLRALDTAEDAMTSSERGLWHAVQEGPVALAELLGNAPALERPFRRLVARGLVIVAGFTPSDAAHVLGRHQAWSSRAAGLGARLFCRRAAEQALTLPGVADFSAEDAPLGLAQAVHEAMITASAECLVAASLAERHPELDLAGSGGLGRHFVRRALTRAPEDGGLKDDGLAFSIRLKTPVVAIGAPAANYYPDIAARLGARVVIPEHAGVCNAIGAVVSSVTQSVTATITSPDEGRYRVHVSSRLREFASLERAAGFAEEETARLARAAALAAGSLEPELRSTRRDTAVEGPGGRRIFIESEITTLAVGRPGLGG